MKTALITGVVGQDGAYLARLLLANGYRVLGTMPPLPAPPGFVEAYLDGVDLRVVDLTDQAAMLQLLEDERPDEIYNLASISSVAASWQDPVGVANVNGLAFLGLLESVRTLRGVDGYEPRVLQASSAEIFGTPVELPQSEGHPIRPTNPYAVAKALAHFSAVNYRDAYGMFVSTVILFNHESALRPEAFVTRKITSAAVRIAAGLQDAVELGRLDIRRDWGAAADFTRAMSLVLAHSEPGDFVVATGQSHSLGEFVQESFRAAGAGDPTGAVRTNPEFVRPTDIPETRGDPTRLREELRWRCEFGFSQIVGEMVAIDRERLESGREHDRSYMR